MELYGVDMIAGIPWVKLKDRDYFNLAHVESCKIATQGEETKVILRIRNSPLAVEFLGDEACLIIERLELLSDRRFNERVLREALTRILKGPLKKRGCKQKPETKKKLEMLSRGLSINDIAEMYGEQEFPKLKAVYLSEGYIDEVADRLARADFALWEAEEKSRLRSLRSDYDLATFQRKRRQKKRLIPTKGKQ